MAAKKEKTNQDMGTGSIKKWMVQLAVPALVGQVINLLYNIVDRIYIGHIPENQRIRFRFVRLRSGHWYRKERLYMINRRTEYPEADMSDPLH